MSRIGLSLLMGLSTVLAGSAFGQPGGRPSRGPGGDLPKVGSILPDVRLYDERGEEFSTKSLRGQYSVLVFGCLT
jgi:cytochrome oxidase Cu insertion factor (SCO1/SenC/PrrC family)